MPLFVLFVTSGVFLGWSLGANHASNAFGIAVTTNTVKYRVAVTITGIFVIIGAIVNGDSGIVNIGDYAFNNGVTTGMSAFLVLLSAGISCTIMTVLKLPISTSQAVIGAIIGWGASSGSVDWSAGSLFVLAWIATPISSLFICFLLSKLSEKIFTGRIQRLAVFDRAVKIGYYLAGILSAYSLGANNVANATGIYVGHIGILNNKEAALIGGIAIAIGAITFGRRVMDTVGARVTTLSPLTGVIVVLSSALTIYVFALIGIPISTSQAMIGAVIGAGLVKGTKYVDFRVLASIFAAWFVTPTVTGILTFLLATLCGIAR
jgi:PiT family inorganic phosphate transporter